jgi:hypothetical protein
MFARHARDYQRAYRQGHKGLDGKGHVHTSTTPGVRPCFFIYQRLLVCCLPVDLLTGRAIKEAFQNKALLPVSVEAVEDGRWCEQELQDNCIHFSFPGWSWMSSTERND